MPTLRVDYLADHPDLIPILAEWHHQQWSYLAQSTTLGQRIERLRQHGRGRLPSSFVALLDDAPVGSAALIPNDMTDQDALSPWLANVYVVPEQRRHGIGATLVQRVVEEAHALGYPRLYLYTEDQAQFYAGLGWEIVERRRYRGYLMTVMALHLNSDTPPSPVARPISYEQTSQEQKE